MWKNRSLVIQIFLLLLVLTPGLKAQDGFSLKGLLDKVLLENYQIRISRNEAQIASGNHTLGQAGFLPQVSLEAGQNLSLYDTRQELFTGAIREGSAAKNTSLNALVNVNWTIFDGFRMFANQDRLGYLSEIGELETRDMIEETMHDVIVAYYQLVQERILLENIAENLQTSRFRYRLESKRLDLGAGNALQKNQAQVDFYTDSIAFLEQQNLLRSLEIQISTFISWDPGRRVLISDQSIPLRPLPNKEATLEHVLKTNPSLRLMQLNEMIAAANVRIQRADLFPQIDFFGRYSYAYQTSEVGFAETSRTLGPQLGINIRLPLYDGGVQRRELKNESIRLQSSAFHHENLQRQLLASMEDLYGRYAAYEQQLRLARENYDAASHSLDIAKAQLEQGTISGYDFRLTQLSRVNARNHIIRLEFVLKSIETGIDRISGQIAERNL